MKKTYEDIISLKSKMDVSGDWNLVNEDMVYSGYCMEDIDYRYIYRNVKKKKDIIFTINYYTETASVEKNKIINSDNRFNLVKRFGIKLK